MRLPNVGAVELLDEGDDGVDHRLILKHAVDAFGVQVGKGRLVRLLGLEPTVVDDVALET